MGLFGPKPTPTVPTTPTTTSGTVSSAPAPAASSVNLFRRRDDFAAPVFSSGPEGESFGPFGRTVFEPEMENGWIFTPGGNGPEGANTVGSWSNPQTGATTPNPYAGPRDVAALGTPPGPFENIQVVPGMAPGQGLLAVADIPGYPDFVWRHDGIKWSPGPRQSHSNPLGELLGEIPGITSLGFIPGLDAPELDLLFPTVFSEDVHRQAGLGYAGPWGAAGMGIAAGAPVEDVAKNAGTSWLISQGADFAAPYVSEGVDEMRSMWADSGEPLAPSDGMFGAPLYSTPAETDLLGMSSTPAMTTYAGPSGSALGGTVAPSALGDLSGMLAFDSTLAEQDAANRDALEAGDVPPAEPTVTSEQLQNYVKTAQKLYDLLGGPEDAPQRAEGQSDSEYSQQLAEYMSLDAQAMADAGLQPGTPEYMEYILAQADAVIAQVTEGMDVDAEDLASQLRGKTEAELLQLQRALFVRGQMDQLMRSGTYADPFGGASQEVIGEGMFNPAVGAYQRGVAGDVEQLAGLYGPDALSFLSERLGRTGDPFGMQAAADARMRQAELEPKDDELRRRRGMFGY
jgi:hypothetical protein